MAIIEEHPDGLYAGFITRLWERSIQRLGGPAAVDPDAPVPIVESDKNRCATAAGARPNTNIADLLYRFRGRQDLPDVIQAHAPDGYEWQLHKLEEHDAFVLTTPAEPLAADDVVALELHDLSDPVLQNEVGNVDEQILLAVAEQNSIVPLVLGARLSEAQRHKRTRNRHNRQIELDSLLLGDTRTGDRVVVPVEAKMDNERLNMSQLTSAASWAEDMWPQRRVVPVAVSGVLNGQRRLAGLEVTVYTYDPDARNIVGVDSAHRIDFVG